MSGSVFGRQDVWKVDKWMAYGSLQLRTLSLEMLNLRVIFAMRYTISLPPSRREREVV
jgi:hypothetical protein